MMVLLLAERAIASEKLIPRDKSGKNYL